MLLNPVQLEKFLGNYLINFLKEQKKDLYIFQANGKVGSVILEILLKRFGIQHFTYGWAHGHLNALSPIPVAEHSDLDLARLQMYRWARSTNGIILDDRNKNEHYLREYQKEEIADFFPLVDLYHSELLQLLQHLLPNHSLQPAFALPQLEKEWAIKQDELHQIITGNLDPAKHPAWLGYIGQQRALIAQLQQREKLTRHKIQYINGLKLRQIPGIVA